MVTQSEAALEQGLIKTLQDMSYEYVKIEEETNLDQNFKTQLESIIRKNLPVMDVQVLRIVNLKR